MDARMKVSVTSINYRLRLPTEGVGLPRLIRDCKGSIVPGPTTRGVMSEKKMSALAAKAADKARKERESENLGKAAVVESEKIRARFDDERRALARRYGVITGLS